MEDIIQNQLNQPERKRNVQVWRRLFQYGLRAKKAMLTGIVVVGMMAGVELYGPYVVSIMLDRELVNGVGAKNPAVFWQLMAIFVATTIVATVLRYASSYLFQKASNQVCLAMQKDTFEHLEKLPIAYFDKLPAGSVVSRVTNDTKAVRGLYQVAMVQILMAVVYVIGSLIGLLLLDKILALIVFLAIPIIFWSGRIHQKLMNKNVYLYRRDIAKINANLNETIQGMDVIRSTNKEEQIYNEFSAKNDSAFDHAFAMVKVFSKYAFSATSFVSALLLAIASLYFMYGNVMGAYIVPIGTLYVFTNYTLRLIIQANNVIMRLGSVERSVGAAEHIFELLDEPTIREGGEPVAEVIGTVKFTDVTFAYKEENVLKNVSFEVPAGKTYAFIGHTGSGKSTIMNLLFGFYEPQCGEITVDHYNLQTANLAKLREHMAIVLQDPFLFKGTIFSNITMDNADVTEDQVRQAMIDVGGESFLARLPEGVHAPVTEKGNAFSAGERQIISFARAMVKNPKILVLDEATSNIDSETEQYITKGIARMAKDRTTIIIAHRLSTIKNADQIVVMDKARIIEVGTHDELIAKQGIYYLMYQAQSDSDLR